MGQLRTANKRRNRALRRALDSVDASVAAADAAPVTKTVKR